MADSRAKYQPIPSSEDQAHSDAHEAGGGDNDAHLTNEWISAKAQAVWTYFLLGCAVLLPWNALVNATPFFLSRLAGSPLYQTFSSSMASVYTLTNLICQFYCTITSKQSSPSRRTFTSITTSTVLISSLCLSTFIRGTPPGFFLFALFNACLLAVTTPFLCTAVYAGAALLGASFLQIMLAGQAAVAVAVSGVQVASSMASLWGSSSHSVTTTVIEREGGQAEAIAARIFFGISAIFLGVTLVAYAWLARLPFYKLVTDVLERHYAFDHPEELTGLVANDGRRLSMGSSSNVFRVFRQNWIFMFSVMYAFAVTLAVFPAVTVRIRSVDLGIHPLLFTSIQFLAFNTGDLVGRHSCTFPRLVIWSAKKILAMALLRTVLIPLFLLCNVDRPATTTLISPIIDSDILFMAMMLTLGYTNGYVSTLALLAVSSLEHNPGLGGRHEDVDVAATIGAAFANLGLAVGSLSSFGVQGLL